MAILSTYAKSEEFPPLCENLGSRLETEIGDILSATLCYMCAANVTKTVESWIHDLNQSNERFGRTDSKALHALVEKVLRRSFGALFDIL